MARWGLRGCAPTVLPGCMWRIVRLSACEIDTQEPEFRETARSGRRARAQGLGHEQREDQGDGGHGRTHREGPLEAVEVEQ